MRSDVKAASLWSPAIVKAAREALTKQAEAPVGILRVNESVPQTSQSAQNQEKAGGEAAQAASERRAAGQGTSKTAAPYRHSSAVTVQSVLASVGFPIALAKAARTKLASLLRGQTPPSPQQLAKQAVRETILGMERSSAGDGSKKPKEEGQLNGPEAWKGITRRTKIGS